MATDVGYRTNANTRHDGHDGSGVNENPSLASLIRDLRDESTVLLREEVALAKTEMSEKAGVFARNAGYLAAGGVVALSGLMVLLFAIAAGLYMGLVVAGVSHGIAGWLAPLIVGLVVVGIGYALVQKAITTMRHESLVPQRTAESLKEDKEWLKDKVQ